MNKKVDFDDYTENYNKLLKEGTSFFSSNEEYFAKYKVDLVRKKIHTPVNRILEYGCGIGRNISFLQQAFPSATIMGSDISSASLEIARSENPGAEFFREDENVGSIGLFDIIFVAGVFHHVPTPQRSIVAKTLFNRLVPSGLLFVFEHNPFNPVTRRIVNNCPYDEDAILLSPKELKEYLLSSGFINLHTEFCLFFPPKLKKLTNLESKLWWVPLGGQYFIRATK